MFFRSKEVETLELDNLCTLVLTEESGGFEWFGLSETIFVGTIVELSIEVENQEKPTENQLSMFFEFLNNKNVIQDELYRFTTEKIKSKSNDIKNMYSLGAISLKSNGEFWLVLQPNFDVPTIYNFFLRFTYRNGEIVWSNLVKPN